MFERCVWPNVVQKLTFLVPDRVGYMRSLLGEAASADDVVRSLKFHIMREAAEQPTHSHICRLPWSIVIIPRAEEHSRGGIQTQVRRGTCMPVP